VRRKASFTSKAHSSSPKILLYSCHATQAAACAHRRLSPAALAGATTRLRVHGPLAASRQPAAIVGPQPRCYVVSRPGRGPTDLGAKDRRALGEEPRPYADESLRTEHRVPPKLLVRSACTQISPCTMHGRFASACESHALGRLLRKRTLEGCGEERFGHRMQVDRPAGRMHPRRADDPSTLVPEVGDGTVGLPLRRQQQAALIPAHQ
jgi:hypothetical protein